MLEAYVGETWLVRLVVQRGLAAIYFVAFLNVVCQFRPLLGSRGLLPVPRLLERVGFWDAPSLFHLGYSDRLAAAVGYGGLSLSILALTGLSESGPVWLSVAVWLCLYLLYLSVVNVGQTFYSFGWESMLLEAGFFAVLLGPTNVAPSAIPLLGLRWMLLRVELGAGLIKLRHDRCWRDLTCLYFHHETQPMPNPLSAAFHHLPKRAHRAGVVFSHFAQLVVPFGLFAPQPFACAAAAIIVVHQLLLVLSGNYAWLNWLTIVLALSAFTDPVLTRALPLEAPPLAPRPELFEILSWALGLATVGLSIQPLRNLLSRDQAMNESYNPLHLVGSYGAFGSVTRERREIVIEGTLDEAVTADTEFHEYELKGKPGDPRRRPAQWAPYHLRLDWLMWFLPLRQGVVAGEDGALHLRYERWFLRLVEKLLAGDRDIRKLLRKDPFDGRAPTFVRASVYRYELTSRAERRRTTTYWKRTRIGDYLRPLNI